LYTGTLVVGVSASDNDASWPNNAVTYLIESGSRDDFVIDPITGQITVSFISQLSTTSSLTYRLIVAAVDAGCPPLKSVCRVDITMVDQAGRSPMFQTSDGRLTGEGLTLVSSVAEDAPVGHVVYTCVAVNPAGAHRLRYHWLLNESRGYDVRGHLVTDRSYVKVRTRILLFYVYYYYNSMISVQVNYLTTG